MDYTNDFDPQLQAGQDPLLAYEFGSSESIPSHEGWIFSNSMELHRPQYPDPQITPASQTYNPVNALPDPAYQSAFLSRNESLTGSIPIETAPPQDFQIFPPDFDETLFNDWLDHQPDLSLGLPPTDAQTSFDFDNYQQSPTQYNRSPNLQYNPSPNTRYNQSPSTQYNQSPSTQYNLSPNQSRSPVFTSPPTIHEEDEKVAPKKAKRPSSSRNPSRAHAYIYKPRPSPSLQSPSAMKASPSNTSPNPINTPKSPKPPPSPTEAGAATAPPSPGSRHKHNQIEKKYRTSLNVKFQVLREALPLPQLTEEESQSGRKSMSKSDILIGALKHIQDLEGETRALMREREELLGNVGEWERTWVKGTG